MKTIRALREKKGLSAKKLADLMEVTPQAVGKWERGEANPSAMQLPVLADLLGCTIDALFGRDGQDSA
ncbi:MAG: helix-turn-helix transcriptional regulator [Oscillibacter sp.]|nr:helix-turn-helix transcriptional regulator [Oscillibacter sp.]